MNIKKYSKPISALGALLVSQCLLVAFLWLKPTTNNAVEVQPLLATGIDAIARLRIDAQESVELQRKNNGWYIDGRVPADESKVSDLLAKLHDLQVQWPVAHSADAATRFDVAEEDFQRRVQIYTADEPSEVLYFGTSPGFNRVHVRRASEEDIFAVPINIQDVPAGADSWIDRGLLRPTGELQSISSGDDGARLEKHEQKWQLATQGEAGADSPLEQDAETVAKTVAALTVTGLVEDAAELDAPQAAAEQSNASGFTLTAVTDEGRWLYTFSQRNDRYYVRRSDIDAVFRIGKVQFETLAKLVGASELS